MNNHSPLPWTVNAGRTGPGEGHVFSGNKLVAGCMGHTDNFTPDLHEINIANAEFIVLACNNHEALLAALKALAADYLCIAGDGVTADNEPPLLKAANAAIRAAEA